MDYMKEAAKYDAKADEQFYEYQDSGNPSTYRSYEKNHERAEAYRLAAMTKEYRNSLHRLEFDVVMIRTDEDPERVVERLKELKRYIDEGYYNPGK